MRFVLLRILSRSFLASHLQQFHFHLFLTLYQFQLFRSKLKSHQFCLQTLRLLDPFTRFRHFAPNFGLSSSKIPGGSSFSNEDFKALACAQ